MQRQWTRDARRSLVLFWDWETGEIVRFRCKFCLIVNAPRADGFRRWYWPHTSVNSFYVLRLDRKSYNTERTFGVGIGDEGAGAAFEVVGAVSERYVTVYSLT